MNDPQTVEIKDVYLPTASPQEWRVLEDVTEIHVVVYGAQGGPQSQIPGSGGVWRGGPGARIEATLPVTPFEYLDFQAGRLWQEAGLLSSLVGAPGGSVSDPEASQFHSRAGHGGGMSVIKRGSDYLVVAAGGGGEGVYFDDITPGGAAAFPDGQDGGEYAGGFYGAPGQGGTTSGGGDGGWGDWEDPADGEAFEGGHGEDGTFGAGGGGGQGLYGGGGGGIGSGGGAGSSYVHSSATNVDTSGQRVLGDGRIEVTYSTGLVAPWPPTLHPVENFDAQDPNTFSWDHNSQTNTNQNRYQLQILDPATDDVVYDSGEVSSSTEEHTVAGGTLVNNKSYRWRVKTRDGDFFSEWSSLGSFHTSPPPVIEITDPGSDGTDIITGDREFSFSYFSETDVPVSEMRWEVSANGSSYLDSGVLPAESPFMVTGLESKPGTPTQALTLWVWDSNGTMSEPTTRSFTVSAVSPEKPVTTVSSDDQAGYVVIDITNPAPGTGVPEAEANVVLRRLPGKEWVTLATDVPPNSQYLDYLAPFNREVEYRVRARSVIQTHSPVTPEDDISHTLFGTGVWLHVFEDTSTLTRFEFDGGGRSRRFDKRQEFQECVGRDTPVVDVDQRLEHSISTEIALVPGHGSVDDFKDLVLREDVLAYRDARGRVVLGVVPDFDLSFTNWGARTTLRIDKVNDEVGV